MADPTAIDFARSFCYYVPRSQPIWVRIQAECRCEVVDRQTGHTDEYVLGVRTQTGLRTTPPSDALDPGYDFWMIFSRQHIFIRRGHTSAYTRNPTRVPVEEFVATGWQFQSAPATPLGISRCDPGRAASLAADRRADLVRQRRWCPRLRDRISGEMGRRRRHQRRLPRGDRPGRATRPDHVRAGTPPEFDDFQWAYLDYRSFAGVRCLLERPTSILSGATYPASPETPRRHPALSAEQVAQIEARLFEGWDSPIPPAALRQLLQTDHYSAVEGRQAETALFVLE